MRVGACGCVWRWCGPRSAGAGLCNVPFLALLVGGRGPSVTAHLLVWERLRARVSLMFSDLYGFVRLIGWAHSGTNGPGGGSAVAAGSLGKRCDSQMSSPSGAGRVSRIVMSILQKRLT